MLLIFNIIVNNNKILNNMLILILRSEILNSLKRQKKLQVSPGEEFNYNNSAFILLAEIVERKTDSKFPDWMKKNVFELLHFL